MYKIISEKILFGPKEEDELTIANEIIAGTRPAKWNVAGHPDHDIWVSILELKYKKTNINNILCGPKEKCFENGECWGHLEGGMCKFLGDGGEYALNFFCSKTHNEINYINVYSTHKEHVECKQRIQMVSFPELP